MDPTLTTTPTKAMTAPQETPLERVVREMREVAEFGRVEPIVVLVRSWIAALEAAPAPVLSAEEIEALGVARNCMFVCGHNDHTQREAIDHHADVVAAILARTQDAGAGEETG